MRNPLLFFVWFFVTLPLADVVGETQLVYPELEPQVVFRVDTESGDAQVLARSGKGIVRWERIHETERIPKADYQFFAVVETGGARLVRFEPISGSTWITQGGNWKRVIEP